MKQFYEQVTKFTKRIQKELGAGFKENILQAALAVEFIQAKIEYEKELSLDVLYKKRPIGYVIADFYIPKQNNFGISEDIIIETKQATLEEKAEYLSQLKIYLKSRAKHLGKEHISKAILIQWDKKDCLAEDHNSITFTADIKIDVWELQRNRLHKIWSSDKND
ncbi:GxxExxY protein [Pseudomonadota bacterium]|nr:GxxExxY protein [Pseudomonadota bacterium]